MRELWIPELVIALFYLLNILRSPVRKLRPLNGLVWLPPIALGVSIGIFPAYGFRLECFPLVIYGLVLNFFNLPALAASIRKQRAMDVFMRGSLFTLLSTAALCAAASLAAFFAPLDTTALDGAARTLTLRDETTGREYFLRVYGTPAEEGNPLRGIGEKPLLVMVPPPLGSVLAVDKICAGLEERGFSVLTFSRRGFDFPALGEENRLYLLSLGELLGRFRLFGSATRLKKVNDRGRALEKGRQEDLEFILSYIKKNRGVDSPGAPLFLAGYGAGGSALILLAGSPGFGAKYPEVRGLMAVESLLWSSYVEEEKPVPYIPSMPGWLGTLRRAWAAVDNWFASRGPVRMAGPGDVPAPELPLLVILSDRSLSARYRSGLYGAIRRTLIGAPEASLFAVAEGAGPLDYTDCPRRYPLIAALFPGFSRDRWNGGDFAGGAVKLMTGFAALTLESRPLNRPGERSWAGALSPGTVPAKGLYTERRSWNLSDPGYIVEP